MAIFFAILLLAFTLPLWFIVTALSLDQSGSDAAGNALARAFTALYTIGLWILLTLLLIIGASHGQIPALAPLVALFAIPLSCISTLSALTTMAKESKVKWPVLLPITFPLLILLYAAWCFFPTIHPATGEILPTLLIWGTLLALCPLALLAKEHAARLAPTPEQLAQMMAAQQESYRLQIADSFHRMTPDDSFRDWWMYATGDTEFRHEARQKLPLVNSRQTEVTAMLPTGTLDLFYLLPYLNLQVTPELEAAIRAFLTDHTNRLMPYDPAGTNTTKIVTDWYANLFPTLRWFIDHGGSCNAELDHLAKTVSQYPDTEDLQKFLTTLQSFHTPK